MTDLVYYDCFTLDMGEGAHDLATDTLKVAFTDRAPDVAADTVFADVVEITASHGYTAGGFTLTGTSWANVGTVSDMPGNDISFVSNTGTVGPFRYLVLYNSSASGGPLIGYWDRGAEKTLDGTISEPFTQHFADPTRVLRLRPKNPAIEE